MTRLAIQLAACMFLASCGPSNQNTCTLTWSGERQVIADTKCGPNEILVGLVPPSTLICARVTALCPKSP